MAPATLQIQDLTVQYGGNVEALSKITYTVCPKRITGIMGPNGAGKSTLLKAMLNLIPPTEGSVVLDQQLLQHQLHRVAYLPQRSLIDWTYPATVWDVVLMGRVRKTGWFRWPSTVSRQIARQALERVGMMDYCDRPIGQLSGGQQQRVFLARALTEETEILLLDEPFAGVDQKTEQIIWSILRELVAQGQMVVVVHHNLNQALTHFDELLLLNRTVVASGTPETVLTDAHLQEAFGSAVPLYAQAA
jgi:manganese/iron transport system ATP-binding protein